MLKILGAVVVAGITAPILATNGQILTDAQTYLQNLDMDMDMPSINLESTQASIEYYLKNPEQLLTLAEYLWNDAADYADKMPGNLDFQAFDGFRADSVPYANNPAYFGGYSKGEIHELYEEAYPGYHQTMASYRRPSSSDSADEGMGLGQLGGLGGANLQNFDGLNMGNLQIPGGGMAGLTGGFPGYTSQAEFNDIVFDE